MSSAPFLAQRMENVMGDAIGDNRVELIRSPLPIQSTRGNRAYARDDFTLCAARRLGNGDRGAGVYGLGPGETVRLEISCPGCIAWAVTVAIKVAIAIPSKPWVLAHSQALSQPWSSVVLGLYGGLMTGATEVGLVWLLVRFTRVGQAPWRNVLGFGVGFGAIEALFLGIGQALSDSDSLLFQIAPIWKRAFTCLGHLATNVMIFYAVARPAVAWFWWALIYKSLIDGLVFVLIVAGYTETLEHIWAIEAMGTVWGVAGLLATLWIGRRYPT